MLRLFLFQTDYWCIYKCWKTNLFFCYVYDSAFGLICSTWKSHYRYYCKSSLYCYICIYVHMDLIKRQFSHGEITLPIKLVKAGSGELLSDAKLHCFDVLVCLMIFCYSHSVKIFDNFTPWLQLIFYQIRVVTLF